LKTLHSSRQLFWVAALAAAVACSSPAGPDGQPVTRLRVGPAGGQVSANGGRVRLTIPPGALAMDKDITIAQINSPASGNVGPVYDIGPSGTQFAQPVLISLRYVSADVSNVDTSKLKIATLSGGAWAPIASTVTAVNSVVSGQIMHLSPWTLVVSDTVVPQPDGGAAGATGGASPDGGSSDAAAGATGGADAGGADAGGADAGGAGGKAGADGGAMDGSAGKGGADGGGSTGTAGAGQSGSTGTAGAGGQSGSTGTAGASGQSGSTGTAGASGQSGSTGTAGASGQSGSTGTAGASGAGGGGAGGSDTGGDDGGAGAGGAGGDDAGSGGAGGDDAGSDAADPDADPDA
jgi:hypothetical protein